MNLFNKKIAKKVGLPPGTAIYTGDSKLETSITLRQYDENSFSENKNISVDEIKSLLSPEKVNWIDVKGFTNIDLINQIGETFNINSLLIEDILKSDHLPKYEEDESHLTFITKGFYKNKNGVIQQNQCCLILGDSTLISFQEYENEILNQKIERIKQAKGRTRYKKSDYLFFVVLDCFVDSIYNFFEEIHDEIIDLEDKLLENRSNNLFDDVYQLNKKLTSIRKIIFPLKDSITNLLEEESEFIEEKNLEFFIDIKDHTIELAEYFNTFSILIKTLFDLNESNLNFNTNKIMKVLTIIATIFIPLTFIAGIYGMNFEHMPELKYYYGYPVTIVVMVIIAIGLLGIMKWKKWI